MGFSVNSLAVAVASFVAFILAYRFYGEFISKRVLGLGEHSHKDLPAHKFCDGVDFVPTKKSILFGHHFTSIAGAAPIVGPAIAVIWGWLPALLWVVFGSIFMGAVHDVSALVISARHDGRTISDISRDIVSPRVKMLFLLYVFFALMIVIAVFATVIANLFVAFPQSVFPIWFEIPLAVLLGYMVYKRKASSLVWSLVALVLMYVSIYVGARWLNGNLFSAVNLELGARTVAISPNVIWIVILLVYAYIASTLPVQTLLQPRDYINSHELFVGLGLMFLGLIIGHPTVVAPALNRAPAGAPALFPFLFITIACGAISGFHSMVSSGTTVKQLNSEQDAKLIGYGAMLWEGALAVMAILACTAGFASLEAWQTHYASWEAAKGGRLGAFVTGGSSFLGSLGIPAKIGMGIMAVLIVSFAATTLDTATRIQRYVVSEMASTVKLKFMTGRHAATCFAVGTAIILAFHSGTGAGGMALWPIFGTMNQMLASLALLVITVYLARKGRPVVYTLIPMLFLMVMTTWGMVAHIVKFSTDGKFVLVAIDVIALVLEGWMVVEGVIIMAKTRRERAAQGEPELGSATSSGISA